MSEETGTLFKALFALEDIREILRQTAPKHELDECQKKEFLKKISEARAELDRLEALF